MPLLRYCLQYGTARIAHELWCLELDRQECSQMAWFDSAALEKMLMDRWVINPPRIKNSSVNQVTHLLNGRSRISKHNFSIPAPYGLENTTGESYFAGHMMTKNPKTMPFHMFMPCPQMHKPFMKYSGRLTEREGVEKKWQRHWLVSRGGLGSDQGSG